MATTTKRSIDDVIDPEQSVPVIAKRLDGVDKSTNASSQPFVRIAFPSVAPHEVPALHYPSQLITFSYSAQHKLEYTNSAMRYYCASPLDADLSYRYENWIKKPESRGRLDGLLEACLREEVKTERKRANIITWRGVMTK